MRHYDICLQTIPGRDAKPVIMDRIAWLKKYLAVRAEFSWTETYKRFAIELAKLEAR